MLPVAFSNSGTSEELLEILPLVKVAFHQRRGFAKKNHAAHGVQRRDIRYVDRQEPGSQGLGSLSHPSHRLPDRRVSLIKIEILWQADPNVTDRNSLCWKIILDRLPTAGFITWIKSSQRIRRQRRISQGAC